MSDLHSAKSQCDVNLTSFQKLMIERNKLQPFLCLNKTKTDFENKIRLMYVKHLCLSQFQSSFNVLSPDDLVSTCIWARASEFIQQCRTLAYILCFVDFMLLRSL